MPGFLFHANASATCPHGGQISTVPKNTKVLVMGMPVVTVSDISLVAGCAFTLPNGKPQPCMKVLWLVPATKILVMGQPAVLMMSSAVCQSAEQIPQGPPIIAATQTKVTGI